MSELKDLMNMQKLSIKYWRAHCDRFDRFLDNDQANDNLFCYHDMWPHPLVKEYQPISMNKYFREENRLIKAFLSISKAPYIVQLWDDFKSDHLKFMFSPSEMTAIRRCKDGVFCIEDDSLFERLIRAGIREQTWVIYHAEHLNATFDTLQDMAMGLFLGCADRKDEIERSLRKHGIYCKWTQPGMLANSS